MTFKVCCTILLLCISCFGSSWGHSSDICSFLRRETEEACNHTVTSSIQGPAGKRGPAGPPGPVGKQGNQGECNCSLDQIVGLLRQVPDLNRLVCTVGMEDRRVRDEDITASSNWNGNPPFYARLDTTFSAASRFWHPAAGQFEGSWVQIDLKTPQRVTGIVTQGKPNNVQWTTSYKISYGNAPNQLQVLQDGSGDVIFQGNRDGNTQVTNMFPQPVIARYIRIRPFRFHNVPILRIELLTC